MAQEGNGILDHAFFYDSENHDRVYGADSFEHWLKKFFTTGVFSGEMQVTANNDMTVTVAGGYINIGGKVKFFQTGQVLIIETAHATYDRIDNIVVERNDTDRDFTVKVVKGGYSSVPAAPTPKRESGIDQRVLAQVKVVHGAVRILQADITDTRTDTDLCGVVTGTVEEYDFQQFQAQFDSYMELYKQSLENYDKEQKALFEKLYEHIRGQLSEDAAGNLQNQIDEAKALYDPDGDGKVVAAETSDNALQLGGNPPTYYAKTDMLTQKYNPEATYKKGRTCIQNDKIWRAKADINTPEAWTEGHWEETSLEQIRAEMESELSAVNANNDIKSIQLYLGYCVVYKRNGIVTIVGDSSDYQLEAGKYIALTTLPEGYRPPKTMYIPVNNLGGTTTIFGRVESNGIISLYATEVTSYWAYSFSFVQRY